jgi:repressor LexA
MAPPTVLYPRLTRQRYRLLELIKEAWEDKGYAPSMRELQASMGYGSASTVYVHLVSLRDDGFVTWVPEHPRTLRITGPGKGALIEQSAIVS